MEKEELLFKFRDSRTPTSHAGLIVVALTHLVCWVLPSAAAGQPSRDSTKSLQTRHTFEEIIIDGILSESTWQTVAVADSFIQIEPQEGQPTQHGTQVRSLFDEKFLYVGALCMDSGATSGIRVQDLRRDFDPANNDLFGVMLDPFHDRRHCVSFQVNRLGALRDLQVFNGHVEDESYDVIWTARVSECPSGWTVEMAIPWRSLRYPSDARLFGLNFIRVVRRANELSAWSPFPRSLTAYRMEFAGHLEGVRPPQPGIQLRGIPFIIGHTNPASPSRTMDAGADLRWGITTTTTADVSINSDFAQADVDQQIINLNRYSIFLPERRVFFTENAGMFRVGTSDWVQPFFSRRIGIDSDGRPAPIHVGLRLIRQGTEEHAGALFVKTGGTYGGQFTVARYSRQLTDEASAGALVTGRSDEDSLRSWNVVGALDGFVRFTQEISWQGMISGSRCREGHGGLSVNSSVKVRTDAINFYWNSVVVTRTYEPGIGYVAWDDLLANELGVDLFLRPSWKPLAIRDFEPALYLHAYHNASDRQLKEIQLTIWPIYVLFNSGAVLSARLVPTWNRLAEPFIPAGPFKISPGRYSYMRYEARCASDASAPIAAVLFASTGRYYLGTLRTLSPSLTLRPIAHASFISSWEWSWLHDVDGAHRRTLLSIVNAEVRLALSPLVQCTLFLRRDRESGLSSTSLRFSWEYRPLSFLYVLLSSYAGSRESTTANQAFVKLNYVCQF